jgi:hypothetical protein
MKDFAQLCGCHFVLMDTADRKIWTKLAFILAETAADPDAVAKATALQMGLDRGKVL